MCPMCADTINSCDEVCDIQTLPQKNYLDSLRGYGDNVDFRQKMASKVGGGRNDTIPQVCLSTPIKNFGCEQMC